MGYSRSEKKLLKEIGSRIRKIRKSRGWSQEQLAFESGLDRTYIGSVERGERNVAVINLKKIGDALGVTFLEILSGF